MINDKIKELQTLIIQKRGIKNTSINSYMKKMGVIMNKAHHDGLILERFKIHYFYSLH